MVRILEIMIEIAKITIIVIWLGLELFKLVLNLELFVDQFIIDLLELKD